jgi:hypothetical protein
MRVGQLVSVQTSVVAAREVGSRDLKNAVEVVQCDSDRVGGWLALDLEGHRDAGDTPIVLVELVGSDLDDDEPSARAFGQDLAEDAATVLIDDAHPESDIA